ncbi:hypothetical protein LPB72_22655 [Hydrogenophaga crassostreae]|uniref:SHOCT domain-containing protein n=1 Tax=Hydrogenophaga crassostreae TaxID=1763535 RepID=A0A162SQ39_9BURK|nr:SHOCT domain-containing protein [Hydrogenophaga crassostreae]AOW11545.1 hypothetical protein LPB072_00380 [Hydrogenophaga crassostreae]OAD39384.1 hypothetical protein LPB72_22655 [Hydrogenophaga crassostreae]
MAQLSSAGISAVQDIAQRHGFSFDAVQSMLHSVINGNGSMAQFNHFEFGGSGQWMRGGMTMVGDMFNNNLKGRVDNLCSELSRLIQNQPDLIRTGSFQSQSQNGNTAYNSFGGGSGEANNPNSLFVAAPAQANWWGPDLKWPNSAGGQNGMRYAWFSQARRLAMEVNGQVIIYDTLDHNIGGVSQQQSGGYSVTFSSQYGYVDLASLPVISINGLPPLAPAPPPPSYSAPPQNNMAAVDTAGMSTATSHDIFASLEKLAALQGRGILSDQEYADKKAELLSRL